MSLRKISHFTAGKWSASSLALITAIILSACASKGDVSSRGKNNAGYDLVTQKSSAAKISDSEKKKNEEEDALLFADLGSAKHVTPPLEETITAGIVETKASEPAELDMAASAPKNESAPFYLAVGGESIGRVAYALYGSRGASKLVYAKNPDLRGKKILSAEQKVYFDLEKLNPEPAYLTKTMIDQYKNELSEKVKNLSNVSGEDTTSVARGETLQMVSERLYGTTRYWTELYLLNKDKLGNYDKLSAGVVLNYHRRTDEQIAVHPKQKPSKELNIIEPPVQNQASRSPAPKLISQPPRESMQKKQEPVAVARAMTIQPIVREPVQAPPTTPPPSAMQVKPVEERALTPPVKTAERSVEHESAANNIAPSVSDFGGSNSRRVIYVALILVIALGAFYMTRPSKRMKNFDMLDVTAENNTNSGITMPPRPKLHEESDSKNKGIG